MPEFKDKVRDMRTLLLTHPARERALRDARVPDLTLVHVHSVDGAAPSPCGACGAEATRVIMTDGNPRAMACTPCADKFVASIEAAFGPGFTMPRDRN